MGMLKIQYQSNTSFNPKKNGKKKEKKGEKSSDFYVWFSLCSHKILIKKVD
jgi:hypothetical protein